MAKNQNIIKINSCKTIQIVAKNMAHEPLKYERGVAEVKRENYKFVESPLTLKSNLVGVCWFYSKLVITNYQI